MQLGVDKRAEKLRVTNWLHSVLLDAGWHKRGAEFVQKERFAGTVELDLSLDHRDDLKRSIRLEHLLARRRPALEGEVRAVDERLMVSLLFWALEGGFDVGKVDRGQRLLTMELAWLTDAGIDPIPVKDPVGGVGVLLDFIDE